MKIAFLTSSRADYGIYLPLLEAMQSDPFFDVRLIVFGTHLSAHHGHTVDMISDVFTIDHRINHIQEGDSGAAIAQSMAVAFSEFARLWNSAKHDYDLVFCLGDRYEMFAAVSAASPYRVAFAHLHGGETTLGAIDNEFRHCITLFSKLHFTATEEYSARVSSITGSSHHVYTVGSLSLENLKNIQLYSVDAFSAEFGIDMTLPTVLVTYHPETVNAGSNESNARNLVAALEKLDMQVVITMPNADTSGDSMRRVYEAFASTTKNVVLIENFGTRGYFSCMNLCAFVAGNSSSGIIEAASFRKHVVNIGDRQKGRAASSNVIHCSADTESIMQACNKANQLGEYKGDNIYFRTNVAEKIIDVVKSWVH